MTYELAPTRSAVNTGDLSLVAPDTDDEKLIYLWLHSGKRGRNVNTQACYLRQWRAFSDCVRKPLQAVTLTDLEEWSRTLTGTPATQRTRVQAVKSLFSFATKVGYLRMSPAVMLEAPPVPETLHRRIVTQADMVRLFDACQTPRETALLRVLYESGCRISETLALTWQDVTPRTQGTGAVLHIVKGKGGKSREAGIKATGYAALMALREESTPPTGYVFATRTGAALDRQAAHKLVKRVAARAGLKDVASLPACHWLRHAHASHALAAGANPADVQAQLGHSSLAVTSVYAHAVGYSADKLPL